jgi:Ca2+-transporting ATPase
MACEGLRVIAFATRSDFPSHKQSLTPDDENDLTFLGFLGLIDPPRPEAFQAVHDCQNASINVVMITGDHPTTAVAIAKKLGILHQIRRSGDDESIITGRELSDLNEHQLTERVKNIRVYARTSPEQKIKIVSALQSNGEIVAMTGDGVNDAPALKRADIGVAMGKGGTDVAREASHMVLLDDNFATIVVAIKEGRRIFDNIRKFTRYVLTGNSGEIWALLLAPFMGMPLPLLPIQILFVNLLTDGLPGIALASEPADKQILRRSPRPPKESIFANGLWEHAIWIGLFLGAATLFAFYIGSHESVQHGQTMAFTVLTLGQLFHVLAIRSESESIFSLGFSSNKQLLIVVLATAAIQVIAIYNPLMNSFFKTHPISSLEFLMCVAIAAAVGTAAEIDKFIRRTQNNNRLSLE